MNMVDLDYYNKVVDLKQTAIRVRAQRIVQDITTTVFEDGLKKNQEKAHELKELIDKIVVLSENYPPYGMKIYDSQARMDYIGSMEKIKPLQIRVIKIITEIKK